MKIFSVILSEAEYDDEPKIYIIKANNKEEAAQKLKNYVERPKEETSPDGTEVFYFDRGYKLDDFYRITIEELTEDVNYV